MTDKDARELFIRRVVSNIGTFWLANMDEMDLSDVLNTVMDTDIHFYDDTTFNEKLTFEIEQLG